MKLIKRNQINEEHMVVYLFGENTDCTCTPQKPKNLECMEINANCSK
jgi:hypothetical protein